MASSSEIALPSEEWMREEQENLYKKCDEECCDSVVRANRKRYQKWHGAIVQERNGLGASLRTYAAALRMMIEQTACAKTKRLIIDLADCVESALCATEHRHILCPVRYSKYLATVVSIVNHTRTQTVEAVRKIEGVGEEKENGSVEEEQSPPIECLD